MPDDDDDYLDSPLSSDDLRTLGEIAYWAAELEDSVFEVVSAAIDWRGEIGKQLMTGLPFSALVDNGVRVFQTAMWQGSDSGGYFTELAQPMKDAMNERNDSLHALWTPFGNGVSRRRLRKRKGLSESNVSILDLRRTAQRLARLSQSMFILWLTMRTDQGDDLADPDTY